MKENSQVLQTAEKLPRELPITSTELPITKFFTAFADSPYFGGGGHSRMARVLKSLKSLGSLPQPTDKNVCPTFSAPKDLFRCKPFLACAIFNS